MLVIRPLPPGGHRYLTAAVGPSERRGEAPGLWLGRAASLLGLADEVDAAVLGRVLEARAPDDSGALCAVRAGRRCGLELVFAAPKSMSVTALLSRPDLKDQLIDAHQAAVADAVSYLEEHACAVRQRGQPVEGAGFVAAAFRHRVSRANDPHLHSHVLLVNLSRGSSGRWHAIHTPLVFREGTPAGAVYAASLRWRTTELGLAWSRIGEGRYELNGVPRSVIDAFSRRRSDVVARRARDQDVVPSMAAAARLTRPVRVPLDDFDSLAESWAARARDLAFDPSSLVHAKQARISAPTTESVLDGLAASADLFRRGHLVREYANQYQHGALPRTIAAVVDAAVESDDIVPVGRGRFTLRTVRVATATLRRAIDVRDDIAVVDLAPGHRRTDLVEAIRLQAHEDGRDLCIAAPSLNAARSMEALTGVASGMVAEAGAVRRMLVVIDADRLSTFDLMRLAERPGPTVLVGARGRSASFDVLLDRAGSFGATDARRELSHVRESIETRSGLVTVHGTIAEARAASVAAWEIAAAGGREPILVAPIGELDQFSLPVGTVCTPSEARRAGALERIVLGAGPVAPAADTSRHVVGPVGFAFVAPPRWLWSTLGTPPRELSERVRWHDAARSLAVYRDRWNVELDTPPRNLELEQRLDRRRTIERITETRRELGLPALSLGLGLSR